MTKYLIFDMDGVIVDSESVNIANEMAVLSQAGIDLSEYNPYQYLGIASVAMWKDLKDKYSLPLPVGDYVNKVDRLKKDILQRKVIKPIKGIHQFLKFLSTNHFRLAVASSSKKYEIETLLESVGVDHYFDVLVSSEEVAHSKPAPDIFLKAAEQLGVSPEICYVIEDSQNGCLAAKAAGTTCIGFANPDYPAQDLSACDLVISNYSELEQYFRLLLNKNQNQIRQ
ncbi:HAD family hydrolase [Streptococcus rifensis]